jgi:hypothetical protein
MGSRRSRSSSLLAEAPRSDAREALVREADLGDILVLLLAGTLAGLRDRLSDDGFADAAELVADLVDIADEYVTGVGA